MLKKHNLIFANICDADGNIYANKWMYLHAYSFYANFFQYFI